MTTVSSGAGALATFALLVVVNRGSTLATTGLFFQCFALATGVAMIASLGAATSLTRAVARVRRHATEDASDVIWAALLPVGLASSALAVTASLCASPLAELLTDRDHAAEMAGLLRVMMLAVPFMALTQLLAAICRGADDPVSGALLDLAGQPLLRLVAALAILASRGSTEKLSLVILVPAALCFSGLLIRTRLTLRRAGIATSRRPIWSVPTATAFWRFSAPRGLEEIVQASSIWLLTLVVGAVGTPVQAASYAAITRFTMVTTLVLQSLTTAILPTLSSAFSRHEWDEARRLYRVTTGWIVIGSMPACLALLLFPTTLLSAVNDDLAQGATGLRVLAVGSLVNVITGPVGGVILMAGRSAVNLGAACLAFVVMMAPVVPLIQAYGASGAAFAWSLALVSQNVLLYLYGKISLGMSPWSSSSVRHVAGATLLTTCPLLFALIALGDSWPGLLLGGVVSVSVMLVVLRRSVNDLPRP